MGKTTQAFPVLAACFGVLVTMFHNSESCKAGYLGQQSERVLLLSLHGAQEKGRTDQGCDGSPL